MQKVNVLQKFNLLHIFFLSLFMGLVITSCSDDDEPLPGEITVTLDDIALSLPEVYEPSGTGSLQLAKLSDYLTVSSSDGSDVTVTYTVVSQSIENLLSISGEYLMLNEDIELDYETISSISAVIKATAGDVSETAAVTLTITDVYEGTWTVSEIMLAIDENPTETTLDTVKLEGYDEAVDGTLSYALSNESPSGALQISEEGIITVKDTALFDFETNPTITATVEVSSSKLYTQSATITINLVDVYEPSWTIADFELTIDENPGEDDDELGSIELVGFNPEKDSDKFTMQLIEESPAGAINLYEDKIYLTIKDPSLFDFETNPTITAKIQITDENGYTQTGNITINLNDVYEVTWSVTDLTKTIDENPTASTALGYISLQNFDPTVHGSIYEVTYELINQEPAAAFGMDWNSGSAIIVENPAVFDYETNPTLTAQVRVTDANGGSQTANITINLNDVDEGPSWTIADFELTIDENPGEDDDELGRIELVGFDSDKDSENFTMQLIEESPVGAIELFEEKIFLAVKDPSLFDYETNPTITAKIQISDENGYTQTGNITINLNDVAEASWTVNDFEVTIDENPTENELGSLSLQGYNPVNDGMITYALSNVSPATALKLVSQTGVMYVHVNNASLFDYETNPTITATVTATDANGASNSANITINLNDVTEGGQWTLSENIWASINENPESGDFITQIMVPGYDQSVDGTLTYVLSNLSHPNAATLTPFGGLVNIYVDDASLFDYETNPTITGTLTVTDGNGISKSANLTINVRYVDAVINIPDANFKNALLANSAINTIDDNEITESEATNFTGTLSATNSSISDVTGIEYFINVTGISLFGNNLTSIDLSNNTKVTQLLIESNDLTTIDISNLTQLVDFKGHSNSFTSVNIANGNNGNMTRMQLQNNPNLTCIKVDAMPVPYNGWVKDASASYSITDCD
ncbi:hypothetical protein R9C00_07860 [Flammeovirgaceae bacterium SG7u.111]|nr:hypothetical protein [Flammeovirgaceae bacterium SG7u.132]WPO37362.1 hypothetical protein R9C00_07860 [Flammeovirgaceae bacterium SG7u.111]